MKFDKGAFVSGFALFSMFFGAGNLILPPHLGFTAGDKWLYVTIGFALSAVVLPLLGILAHAKLQGTMMDFSKKISPLFSYSYCFMVYLISVALPSPRTASVAYEMAIEPFFEISALTTSTIYFSLVLFFVLNRSKILNLLGRYLTPIIITVILSIIAIAMFLTHVPMRPSDIEYPLITGMLEGNQTFDTIGAVVVGGVVIISLRLKGRSNFEENKKMIRKSGIIAGIALFIVYAGLIYTGAASNASFDPNISRTALLSGLSSISLGKISSSFLGLLVALACFTTAVGIVTGTADFVKGVFNESKQAYTITAILGCILGIGIGQLDVHDIIIIAIPALMFIYPITIVLILLNILPEAYASSKVFKVLATITILFSIPDFIGSIMGKELVAPILEFLPLGKYSLAWLFPCLIAFLLINFIKKRQRI